MRVLYLLLLVPLGALASCPAGLQLSNVPISTALPYCVKWESSSLGGCEVNCPGVCVEMPNADSKGPIQTTGSECKLGGGGDTGGGETGGGNNGDVGPNAPMYHAPAMWVGNSQSANLAPGFDSVSKNIERLKNLVGQADVATRYEMSFMVKDLAKIAQNTSGMNGGAGSYGPLLYEMNAHLKSLSEKSVFDPGFWNDKDIARTKQLSDIRQDMSYTAFDIGSIANIMRNGGGSSGGGGGSSSGDTQALVSMMSSAMSMWAGTQANTGSSFDMLRNINSGVASVQGRLDSMNNHQLDVFRRMSGDLGAIKDMMKNGQGSGGAGNEGGADIDYSKMPGAAGNPLQVAGAEYESGLCQEGDNCAFDLGNINKQYDDKKEELKDKYKAIKDEVAEIFKFDLSGTGSVPKCFELYSLFGKSYSVCPSVGGYWEALAAIMMFVFYFLALMIVARR